MKIPNSNKYKLFPYATTVKKPTQQWNHLLKLSAQKKRFFKNKTRFFSMEFGRSLPKRLFWQIAQTPFDEKNLGLGTVNSFQTKSSFPQFFTHPRFAGFEKFQHNWTIFRSLFFGKMWMLNNPSLVPGVVWPVKSKKILVAKMRAFKALCHLTGKGNLSFILRNTQKLWASTNNTKPSLWCVASGLDSLKANSLMKTGFVPTFQTGFHWISYGKVSMNGFVDKKGLSFYYPGDFIQISKKTVFSSLFNSGPRFQSLAISKKNTNSIYTAKTFLWLSSFFKSRKFPFLAQKKLKYTNVSQKPKKYFNKLKHSFFYL